MLEHCREKQHQYHHLNQKRLPTIMRTEKQTKSLAKSFFIEAKENCNHEINQLDGIGWQCAHSHHPKVVKDFFNVKNSLTVTLCRY